MAGTTDPGESNEGARGPSLARLAKIALVLVALALGTLVAAALLNPQPEQHRIDYGGFER